MVPEVLERQIIEKDYASVNLWKRKMPLFLAVNTTEYLQIQFL